MQLRTNCLYQARNGNVVGPLQPCAGLYPFYDRPLNETYTEHGATYLGQAATTDILTEIGSIEDGWKVNPGRRAGGTPGLSDAALVEVVLRNGNRANNLRAAERDWAIRDLPSDIIAYRVTTPLTIEERLAKVEAILAKFQSIFPTPVVGGRLT